MAIPPVEVSVTDYCLPASNEWFWTAIHEAGHGIMALIKDPRQYVRLELMVNQDGAVVGQADSDVGTPMGLTAGFAAELMFGQDPLSAARAARWDYSLFLTQYPDLDWGTLLQDAMKALEPFQDAIAAAAQLLLRDCCLREDALLCCIADPRRALRQSHPQWNLASASWQPYREPARFAK